MVIAVGNDAQFKRFADWIGKPEWADNPSFTTNPAGLSYLNELVGLISDALKGDKTDTAIKGLGGIGVPVGPVKTLDLVCGAGHVKPHGPGTRRVAVARLLTKLDAVVG